MNDRMDKDLELIEAPLSTAELAARYREMCDDARFSNLPGKVELDLWGRVLMTPASTYHGLIQGRLSQKLAGLGGETLIEVGIATLWGLFVPDVAWASAQFMAAHADETPLTRAPELCIEVVSPSNSVKEMDEKRTAYLATGAREVWIVYPESKRWEIYGSQGQLDRSAYPVDWVGLFPGS
jgi:Uma2 family endonuclease